MIPEMLHMRPDRADLVFMGVRAANRARVDGYLIHGLTGSSWEACSGSRSLLPLPPGWYLARNFRHRTEPAMTRFNTGFSVDLDPLFPTTRTLLRIHPDGNAPGTAGCIGITDVRVAECCTELKQAIAGRGALLLWVQYR